MYYKLKSKVLFRNYESFGYLTDTRNFGYKLLSSSEYIIGDKILSESGALFLSVLSRSPQALESIASRIIQHFSDVDIKTIIEDVREFYCVLEQDGFIVSGETIESCNEKDIRFSYKNIEPIISEINKADAIIHPLTSTQDYLEDFFKGKPQLTNVHIEINSHCNERCLHCYIPHEQKLSHMESTLFYNIMRQCKELKVLHVTLSGGEPMLHKDFCNFLRKCREYDFSVNVLSNLTLLNDEILHELKMNPLLGVQVSLYSMDEKIHDGITHLKGSFKKTKDAILKLVENDIPLQISCPIIIQNKNSYENVIEWATELKIHVGDDYGIIAKFNHTTENLSCRLSISQIEEILNQKVNKDDNFIDQIKAAAKKKKDNTAEDFICSVCHSSICIADNGNVYPCAGWQDYVVGNVKETNLNEIWDNSEKANYLRSLRYQDLPKCISCPDRLYCNICMVRNANESPSGDPLELNKYFCSIAQLNRQLVLDKKDA